MKNVKIDGRWYMGIDYHPYISNNLSRLGCVIFDEFDYPNYDFEELKKDLMSRDDSLKEVYKFPLNVYCDKDKTLHTYWTFVNEGNLSSFMFFDIVRLACGSQHLNKFYACDFQSEKIYEMTPAFVYIFGELNDLKTLLKLDENSYIVGKCMRWCAPPGYSRFYEQAKVFRNDAEREFYNQYSKNMRQQSQEKFDVDTYYTLRDCKDKLSPACLEFDNMTELEFDIDNPDLNIVATTLKARNLNVKSIKANEIFCGNLKCKSVEGDRIFAESIECEEIKAKIIKTNFKYGIKFIRG